MQVAGTVIAVIGGGNGIGRQVVLELLRRGARVAAADIRADSLAETADIAAAGDRLMTMTVDITDRAVVEALPGQVIDALGQVDGVIVVAGVIQPFVRLAELDHDAIQRVIDINLWGTIHVLKAFLPHLLVRPAAHIATFSSMGGFLPVPGQTIYGASKAAVKLMTEGLYAELLDTHVGVSVVMPGAVATEITANSGVATPGGAQSAERSRFPMTSAENAARIVVDGIEAGDLHIHVGRDSRLMGLATRIAPRRATHLITRKMKSLLG
ncbi:SDR family NAD(P)-dependent oxidoreductase [Euzebya sp.]|uniref:SDR family NAD(P)-dependent oxidoreductase n=1 Tax=Euzebya sp. TaxID=1971409 RepID=UPI003519A779